ncbi:hypothetical protein [Oligella urethralis]|uniref:DUF4352 domain-containing protein n=1 Tax=Oligella urethralis TaxID=90245 RepID=A0A2X1UWQ6_9BURK|nr:hypothetical protein [Oligella urethralis]SPY08153.1 Uncharacterised protein [Oligella urethralis]
MKNIYKLLLIAMCAFSANTYALTTKEAAELFPVTITAIDEPKESYFNHVMIIHYEIENLSDKDVTAIESSIVFENPDGSTFISLAANSLEIKSKSKANGQFGYDFNKSNFTDKKMQLLGLKMKTWLKVKEIIYSDGTYEAVSD